MTGISILRVGILSAFALSAPSMFGQEKLKNPTYEAGKSYELEMVQDMVMDMTAMGQAVGQPLGKTTINMTMVMLMDCKAHTTPGHRAVTATFKRMAMAMDMGAMKMSYDSADPESANSPMAAGFQPMMELEIVTILDENDKVVEVQGMDKLAGVQGLDQDQLKQMTDPASQLGIPAEGVVLGQAWENAIEMPMGEQLGKVAIKMSMKYEKDEEVDGEKLAIVNYTGKINMEVAGEAGAPAMMKVEDATLEGTMRFNKAKRIMRKGNTLGKMGMSMANPAGGENLNIPVEFDQTFTMKEIAGE